MFRFNVLVVLAAVVLASSSSVFASVLYSEDFESVAAPATLADFGYTNWVGEGDKIPVDTGTGLPTQAAGGLVSGLAEFDHVASAPLSGSPLAVGGVYKLTADMYVNSRDSSSTAIGLSDGSGPYEDTGAFIYRDYGDNTWFCADWGLTGAVPGSITLGGPWGDFNPIVAEITLDLDSVSPTVTVGYTDTVTGLSYSRTDPITNMEMALGLNQVRIMARNQPYTADEAFAVDNILVVEVPEPSSADFDEDGDTDGDDFLVWQRGFGDTYDASDLALWESEYGSTSLTSSVAAVPEPTSWFLACAMALASVAIRRW